MRPKPLLAAVAALALLGLIVRQITQAVRHTFTPPAGLAQIDRASPRTQNGLTLLEIQNVAPDRNYTYNEKYGMTDNGGSTQSSANDTGLWIKMPNTLSLPPNCHGPQYPGCAGTLSVTGRAPNGEMFPLDWYTQPDTGPPSDNTFLLASIPAGYPDTIRWMDVTVDDKRGDAATWRITHLPPMQHVLAPPVKPQTTFHQGNIEAVARAYSGPDPNNPSPTPGIRYDLKGTITGAAHQWELGHMTQRMEWEPPGYVPQESGMTSGPGKDGSTVHFEQDGQQLFYNRSYPYLADTHWVQLSAKLQEFETYDETVVFHNVSVFKPKTGGQYLVGSGPQTVTTPSGVTITLDDVQHKQNFFSALGGSGYCLHLLYPQMMYPSLPLSPLWRKYKAAISISANFSKPYTSTSSTSGNNEGTYMFGVSGGGRNGYESSAPLPKVIANFPVIIRQRVDLRSVPMTFTLPLAGKPPKTAW